MLARVVPPITADHGQAGSYSEPEVPFGETRCFPRSNVPERSLNQAARRRTLQSITKVRSELFLFAEEGVDRFLFLLVPIVISSNVSRRTSTRRHRSASEPRRSSDFARRLTRSPSATPVQRSEPSSDTSNRIQRFGILSIPASSGT